MTMADKIAEQFDNDGQNFRDANGVELDDVCCTAVVNQCHVAVVGDSTRYDFEDGSSIVASTAWDLGYTSPATCHCWASMNHHCGLII